MVKWMKSLETDHVNGVDVNAEPNSRVLHCAIVDCWDCRIACLIGVETEWRVYPFREEGEMKPRSSTNMVM